MEFAFNPVHLEPFQDMATPGAWKPRIPIPTWVNTVGLAQLDNPAWAGTVDRTFLKAACRDSSFPDRDLLWGILAWGGMRLDAARRLKRNEPAWVALVKDLRENAPDRVFAYRACQKVIEHHPSGGIGPAFFTKLIFFANPRHDGYIMDQWTARSVNLLVEGPPVVSMRTPTHVDPGNGADTYERFCRVIETLSHMMSGVSDSIDPEWVEMCLFSRGGRPHEIAAWRKWVRKHGKITPSRG